MNDHTFSLVPFPDPDIPHIQIQGGIARTRNLLAIQYRVAGEINKILFPAPVLKPVRRMELWLATCFEFFLALPGQPQYWEFNLSPSGEWNVFRMDAYRRAGFREEELIQDLRVQSRVDMASHALMTALDLSPIIEAEKAIQAGIASVIQTRDGHETYWALAHPQPQADFHVRESFTLELEGTNSP